ncbi:MAG: hypothetical protein H0W62_07145 [Chitinophagales bacterium]|nr:hypothetical protein [Chitinophagales bacterium]
MKLVFLLIFFCSAFTSMAQNQPAITQLSDTLIVDAACGQCKLGMKGKNCSLAIRIKDKSYFVDGTDIDSHGDAHTKDGFCNAIRKAAVVGEIVNGRFVASYFMLLKEEPKKE